MNIKKQYFFLSEIAQVIRSKNAGPFEVTMDIIFGKKDLYEMAKKSGKINKKFIAELYKIPVEKIYVLVWYDLINAVKITMARNKPQGSIGETDMHSAQQHAPLLNIKIPIS
jgi:hypothetical protein